VGVGLSRTAGLRSRPQAWAAGAGYSRHGLPRRIRRHRPGQAPVDQRMGKL